QITRSPSLTWLASISLTFLLPCAWLTHWVELSYCTVFSSLEPGLRTVKVDLSGLLLMTVPSQRSCFAILSIFSIFSWAGAAWTSSANTGKASTDPHNRVNSFFANLPSPILFLRRSPWHQTIGLHRSKSKPPPSGRVKVREIMRHLPPYLQSQFCGRQANPLCSLQRKVTAVILYLSAIA